MSEEKRVTLKSIGFKGDVITSLDNQKFFVSGGIPGEEVIVEIVKRPRNRTYAKVKEVIEPSPYRVVSPCPYFGRCGGCQWQHIEYRKQLELKKEMVQKHILRRFNSEELEVKLPLGMSRPWHYRNQARFTVRSDGKLGFNEHFTKRFMQIDKCLILHPKINDVLKELQGRCMDIKHQIVVRYGFHTKSLMVFPEVPVDNLSFKPGNRYFEERLLGHSFKVFNSSFFQTNTLQTETIIGIIKDKLKLTGKEVLVDAYCGVGALGVLLASDAGYVIGIEESKSAISDARENIKGFDNIELIEGKTEDVLPKLKAPIDVIIIDPPRTGCNPVVLKTIKDLNPERIIYISCDAYTLARDLNVLLSYGFKIEEIQPVDMFPQTYHIESVTTLYL